MDLKIPNTIRVKNFGQIFFPERTPRYIASGVSFLIVNSRARNFAGLGALKEAELRFDIDCGKLEKNPKNWRAVLPVFTCVGKCPPAMWAPPRKKNRHVARPPRSDQTCVRRCAVGCGLTVVLENLE